MFSLLSYVSLFAQQEREYKTTYDKYEFIDNDPSGFVYNERNYNYSERIDYRIKSGVQKNFLAGYIYWITQQELFKERHAFYNSTDLYKENYFNEDSLVFQDEVTKKGRKIYVAGGYGAYKLFRDITTLIPPYGFSLDFSYTKIEKMKYSLPGGYELYEVSINPFVYECSNIKIDSLVPWCNDFNQTYTHAEQPQIEKIIKKKSRQKFFNIKKTMLIAVRDRCSGINCRVNVLYLSKEFIGFYQSKDIAYYLFQEKKGGKEVLKGNDNYKTEYYPLTAQDLIPFIYIMSWSDYEPEEVYVEKEKGNIYYYKFYSNRLKKNIRVKFNNKTINFEKYSIIK